MNIFFWILVFLGTFSAMEFMAWFTHARLPMEPTQRPSPQRPQELV